MKKSETFHNFLKIAQEKGLLKQAEKDLNEEAKRTLEKTKRVDSLTLEQITKLYNTKPEAPKDLQYQHNIGEVAHPNSMVIAPAYDALNGLVENDNERQNILLNIVNKVPSGHYHNFKMAEQNLITNLVRVGNLLDRNDQDQLAIQADHCLQQLTLKKSAQALVFGGVAALLGALYAKQHLRFVSDGLEQDHQKLINEIDDLLNSSETLGVGYQYKPQFLSMMTDFRNRVQNFFSLYKQVEPILEQLEAPHDTKELMALSKQTSGQQAVKAIAAFKAAAFNLLPYLRKIEQNFSNESFKQRQIADKGMLTSLVDSTQVLHGGAGLIADDFDDVRHALQTYLMDIGNVVKVLESSTSLEENAARELSESAAQAKEMMEPAAKPAEKSDAGLGDLGELDKQLEESGLK